MRLIVFSRLRPTAAPRGCSPPRLCWSPYIACVKYLSLPKAAAAVSAKLGGIIIGQQRRAYVYGCMCMGSRLSHVEELSVLAFQNPCIRAALSCGASSKAAKALLKRC